jgi:uncharacterized protein (DUF1800 family)
MSSKRLTDLLKTRFLASACFLISCASSSAATSSPAVTTSVASAARLLDQSTFGPTLTDIAHVQSVGISAYLAEQFAAPPTLIPNISNPAPSNCASNITRCEQSSWWKEAFTAQDQLRQRVAFALSEMFVISSDEIDQHAIPPYQNILVNDAFTNFATLMRDIALSPSMGDYLNMVNSSKPSNNDIANENFAREMMQLFTTGLYLINPDGTQQLSSGGQPQPVYTEAQVQAFARAYTGWTYAGPPGSNPTTFPNPTAYFYAPMVAVESAHDTNAKTLLLGTTLPAGQSAEQDLSGTLTNLFNNPNVGPFVCKQLIQHLVSSNPSPGYVERVAATFANNGQGVRGDMTAIVTAILTDEEARAGDTNVSFDGGHLRESLLYMTGVMRGLRAINVDPNDAYFNLSYDTSPLGEEPYAAPSVFNFFPPNYTLPGSALTAPEFALENSATVTLRLNLAEQMVFNSISSISVNLDAYGPLGIEASHTGNAVIDSGNLVDYLAKIFMHGQMPEQMRDAIVQHVATLTNIPQRVRVATYLVISSPLYKINH